ncbi:MAG TPA: hypothetical protein VHD56_01260 [Tepidisphaeraceae bacterium]|nr:hypothetical protein [Tepidisphaeraceae bacterium]
MRTLIFIAAVFFSLTAQAQQMTSMDGPRVYAVDRRVSDMPPGDDFSKPERAYASIHRRLVSGDDDWRAMSIARLGPTLPKASSKPIPLRERAARGYIDARIAEVRIVSETIAYVIAQWPTSGSYDVRCFELEDGRWLNAGDSQSNTIESARKVVDDASDTRRASAAARKSAQHSADYLTPFVQFLHDSAKEPKELILDAIRDKRLVAVAQIPHRPTYWKLLTDAVSDPRFVARASVIFMQLPQNNQTMVDRFLSAPALDPSLAINVLRDAEEAGAPDQSMLDFLVAIYNVNEKLPPEQRVRIICVDAPQPWKVIRQPSDLRAYDINHDEFIAHAVLRDLLARINDARHSLLVLDFDNAPRNLRWRTDDSPVKTAGWHLSEVLGQQFFIFLQHAPQISTRGTVSGRACRGLFDTAFASNQNNPVAFALAHSPFGTEPFDASADLDCSGSYRDGFDGYLFAERLENEYMPPSITDFYTEEFVKEIDRRHQIIHGKGIGEEIGVEDLDATSFLQWLNQTWGQPRAWKAHLGPIDAWRISPSQPAEP